MTDQHSITLKPDLPSWASYFSHFPDLRVLVIGDMMLDQFIWGRVNRISPEAPVPVVEVERESFQPGGASNVVNNIVALGAGASIVGIMGNDVHGDCLRSELGRCGGDLSGIVIEPGGITTVKTRVVAHSQQVVRVDRERSPIISDHSLRRLEENAVRLAQDADAILFSDYAKGVITGSLVESVRRIAKSREIPMIANPKPPNLIHLNGITAISINQSEAEQAVGRKIVTETDLESAGSELLNKLQTSFVLITLGGRGLALFSSTAAPFTIPAAEVPVYDVAGAGDTVVSIFTLAMSSGATAAEAAEIANMAAGTVVRKVGVATTTVEEILNLHRETAAIRHRRSER